MNGKILIIGKTKNLGIEVLKQFISSNKQVVVLTEQEFSIPFPIQNIEHIHFTPSLKYFYTNLFKEVSCIIILSVSSKNEDYEKLLHILDHAYQNGIQKVILKSAFLMEAIQKDNNILKLQNIIKSKFEYTIVASNISMDNFASGFLHKMLKNYGSVVIYDNKAPVSFTSTIDTAQVIARIALENGHEYKTYQITGETVINHADFVKEIAKQSSINYTIEYTNDEQFHQVLNFSENNLSSVKHLQQGFELVRRGLLASTGKDTRELLGRTAETPEEFIKRNLIYWR